MASLVLKMSVSLDGYVAPPDGSSDWAAAGRSEDGAAWTLDAALRRTADHRAREHHRLQPRSRCPRLRGAPVIKRDRQ